MDFETENLEGLFHDVDQDSELSQLGSAQLSGSTLSSSQFSSAFGGEYESTSDSISVRQPSSPPGTVSGLSDHSTLTPSASGSLSLC